MSKHLDIAWTTQFKKDYKLAMKRHLDIDLLDNIIRKLASSEPLPEKNRVNPKFCVKSNKCMNGAKFICRRQRLDRLPPMSTT